MITRRRTESGSCRLFAVVGRLLGLALSLVCAQAQTVNTLVHFTNSWRFDQSGRDLTSTLWRTNTYVEDGAWSPPSPGLLGNEPDTPAFYTIHAPINTPLTISTTVTSYYFRTTFDFTGSTNGLSLVASNLMDDGCVIFLNGREAGRFRLPANQNATTLALGGTEGQLDVVTFTNLSLLRQGTNLLAVEVHQSSANSADIMWGMKLMAIRATPLSITNQPQSQVVMVGDPVNFSAGISGGPAFYQWQRNGVNVPGATNSSYTLSAAQLSHAGTYRVIVTNSVSSAISSDAVLTVHQDTTGPKLVSAIVQETGETNAIIVEFNEVLRSAFSNPSTTNLLNYRITRCDTAEGVDIDLAQLGVNAVRLFVGGTNWVMGGCYYLTVNNVTDTKNNRIAPDSQIGISWPRTVPVFPIGQNWRFHDIAFLEPEVANTHWYASDFVESFWWADGTACFYFGLSGFVPCIGGVITRTPISFQPEPTLFRTWFYWPTNLPTTNTTLRPRFAVDDGAVFYLNGVEVYRHNMPGGPLNSTSKAASIVGTPLCVTNTGWPATNLVSGSNCFAVAIFQANNTFDADTFFCFELDIGYLQTSFLDSQPEPVLETTLLDTGAVRLRWTAAGYALESTTNLTDNSASYPIGPWQEVPRMSNPYTNLLEEPQRFFRLKK